MDAEKKQVRACFWCMKAFDGETKIDDDSVLVFQSYEPCDKCKEIYSHGIRMIGVTNHPQFEGMPPIGQGNSEDEYLYPGENVFIAPEDMVKRILDRDDEKELLDAVLENRVMLMPDKNVGDIIEQAKKANGPMVNVDDASEEETAEEE
jgi:hypothetical protein